MAADRKTVVPYLCPRWHPSGYPQGQGRRGAYLLWIPLAALAAIFLSHSVAAAPMKEVRRILILNEMDTSYPGMRLVNDGIQAALNDSPYHLQLYSEHMDTSLFPDPADQQEFRELYMRKYQNLKPDVIITVGPSPLQFMEEVHQRVFPGVPIVFCVPNANAPGAPALDSDFTGVENDMAPAETVQIGLQLQPGTKNVVVVGGVAPFDRQGLAAVKEALKAYEGRLDISYLTDLAVPDLLKRLHHLPNHTLVLLTSVGQDAAGTTFKANEIGTLVAAAANAPVFGLFDVFLNHGEVGGYLSSLSEQGKVAGGMARRLLSGEKPWDIPTVKSVNAYMFDWRAIKRWRLMEKEIPPGSVVINRQYTMWALYKWYMIAGITLIVGETVLVFGLVWQMARRRDTEAELAITYDRLRMAVEAGRSVGWDWDINSGRNRWFGDLATVFGIPSDSCSGHVDDFHRIVHPDDREHVRQALADAGQNRKPYAAELRVIRSDGTVRWITARGKFYYAHNGGPERMLGMAVDISDRKQAEEQLRESQSRLAGIVGSAMDAIIAVDEEQRIVLFNNAAEKMFGNTHGEVVGTVIDRFIPLRFRSEHRAHIHRFGESGATTRTMGTPATLWAVRANGQEFPIEASITHLESDGRKLFTVIVRDITERRLAEQSVRESEERFRLVANTAPVMIWMSGADKLCNYFNQPWLDFTGRSIEAELGDGWAEMMHPEDFQGCLDTYREAFDRHERFEMQYRLRRYDGEYRWLSDIGVPRFDSDGSFVGYIGSCIDVTDRRLAEEAMADIGRRLIEAHEEERTWIGRELHDDINQRIALAVIELEQWRQELSKSGVVTQGHGDHIKQGLSDLGTDVQALSHRLHSSKLDYLGLTVAASGFCRELSEQQKVEIDFTHEGMPSSVPKEISLCLFRVLQEALQNAVKYSRVKHFTVKLQETTAEIQLTIGDLGVGFDYEHAVSGRGLGLISMRERMQLVKGKLSITSQPGGGTTVCARVPFKGEQRAASLAG